MKLLILLILVAACQKTSSPALHPTNRKVVFVAQSGNINYLFLMDLNNSGVGFNPRRITSNKEAENYPNWSPDGRKIVFQRNFNGSGIYIVNVDGTNLKRISPTPGFDVTPSWSPDGKQIIFSRLDGPMVAGHIPKTEIHIINTDGSGDHVILPAGNFNVEPRWSVNNQVVFMSLMNGGQQIFTMNIDGSHLTQLTSAGSNGDPAWSPDGRRISFGSNREGNDKLNIFVMSADGSHVVQLTHFQPPLECGDTNWSSDGEKIIFEYDVNGHLQSDPDAYAEVWTMNSDGSQQTSTGQTCSGVGAAPKWQPGK